MKLFLPLILLALLASCSSSKKNEEKKQVAEEVTPTAQVQVIHPQTFSPDELKRIELMERYRKMREETLFKKNQLRKTQKKDKAFKILQPKKKEKVTVKELKVFPTSTLITPTPAVTPKPSMTKEANMSDELRIQLDQHMSYYCIKFESRFSRPSDCRAHAENILKNCQDKKDQDPSLNLVQCLKKNM